MTFYDSKNINWIRLSNYIENLFYRYVNMNYTQIMEHVFNQSVYIFTS